jgi:hypothetical protein
VPKPEQPGLDTPCKPKAAAADGTDAEAAAAAAAAATAAAVTAALAVADEGHRRLLAEAVEGRDRLVSCLRDDNNSLRAAAAAAAAAVLEFSAAGSRRPRRRGSGGKGNGTVGDAASPGPGDLLAGVLAAAAAAATTAVGNCRPSGSRVPESAPRNPHVGAGAVRLYSGAEAGDSGGSAFSAVCRGGDKSASFRAVGAPPAASSTDLPQLLEAGGGGSGGGGGPAAAEAAAGAAPSLGGSFARRRGLVPIDASEAEAAATAAAAAAAARSSSSRPATPGTPMSSGDPSPSAAAAAADRLSDSLGLDSWPAGSPPPAAAARVASGRTRSDPEPLPVSAGAAVSAVEWPSAACLAPGGQPGWAGGGPRPGRILADTPLKPLLHHESAGVRGPAGEPAARGRSAAVGAPDR